MSKNYHESIDAVINHVLEDASKTVAKKIDILVKVCSSQIDANSNDFSIATIAKLFKAQGGVNEQSINNKSGKKYKDIILAFQAYHGIESEVVKKATENHHWIDNLDNSLARFEAMELVAENKRLKSQLQTQVEINRKYAPIVDMRKNRSESKPNTNEVGLTSDEVNSIKAFFSQDNLKELGLRANEKGRLIDESQRSRSQPGFVKLINKICGVEDKSSVITGTSKLTKNQ